MNNQELTKPNDEAYSVMEKVIAQGDLSKLSSQERVMYMEKLCSSLSINPLTQPFEYILMKGGKLKLYPTKNCAEQLRASRKITIHKIEKQLNPDGIYIVTAYASTPSGQMDVSTGVVSTAGLKGEELANAYMKAETKAKRRVTLSIAGLSFFEEMNDHSQDIEVQRVGRSNSNAWSDQLNETPSPAPVQITKTKSPTLNFYIETMNKAATQEELKTAYDTAKKNSPKNEWQEIADTKDERKDFLVSVERDKNLGEPQKKNESPGQNLSGQTDEEWARAAGFDEDTGEIIDAKA